MNAFLWLDWFVVGLITSVVIFFRFRYVFGAPCMDTKYGQYCPTPWNFFAIVIGTLFGAFTFLLFSLMTIADLVESVWGPFNKWMNRPLCKKLTE